MIPSYVPRFNDFRSGTGTVTDPSESDNFMIA
jgi:hypothetical protein